MKTLYAACIARLGLSLSEAANLHRARIDSVKSWCAGRRTVPAGAWDDLRGYEAEIVDRSEAIREAWQAAGHADDVFADVSADARNWMALADFVLTTDDIAMDRLKVSGI